MYVWKHIFIISFLVNNNNTDLKIPGLAYLIVLSFMFNLCSSPLSPVFLLKFLIIITYQIIVDLQ